ncbi:MAG: hypothetical protein KAS63_10225, partial [Candidatus Heimdallarchaeota archaeon]|nr:hypothetical protein [Candidatus Heimdallarchaeota archaeon]MCK4955729.1 hypothetical protein [Candidatus Heimdallarchaeota archaeon]
IDLGDLGILKPNIVRLLDEHNIVTIEDLYFSTFKDKWFLEELPWYVIESFKAILNLPLNHISDMLDPEIIGILEEASIFTLLGFMLTSPEILMEKTGIADERFETIKSGLDLADIFGYFSLPVYFLPNLSFKQTETLRENGIGSIAEFILTSPEKLSKLLKNTPSENNLIISSLNTSSAQAIYEHKGIFAFETKLFDKLEQKFLSRDSIFQFERFQTIQELFYAAEEQFYYSNPELWTKISAIQKYLSLPLKIFTEISEFSQEVLEQNDIKYVYQLLFIPDADLTDPVLYRVVSNYSSKIIIMQAFHYFAKLPSTVYNAKYFKRIVQNIENKTLSDVITDTKVIKDLMDKDRQYLTENYNLTLIRSILELPLRITPFFTRIRRARRDEYKDVIIGDVFDINLEEHSALSPFYSRLLEVDSLDRLIMELSIPIASMGLPRNLALKLSKSAINTLIDFYSTPEKLLSEISGFSMKEIREIKEDLTYSDIVAFRSSQAHAIRPAEILSEKQVEDLKDIGILDVEAFYYSANIMGISKIISIEDYKKIRELLSGSIRFVGFLSFEEIKNLEFNEINSVIDLALLNKKELFEITQNLIYQEFHVLDLISFDELAERRIHSAIPLTVCPSIEEDYLEKLTDIGINSVQDFISRMEEIRESRPALVNLDIFREVQLYKSSVAFIGLNNKQIQQLIYSGVSDILSFITEDISTIALILKTSEKVVQSYLDKITPPNLMKKVKRKGVLIENFTALSKGRITSLLRSGKEYVQDLYSHQYQALPTLNVSEEYMSDFLNSCNISVFRIKELTSEEKLKLTRDGIIRLIDLFNCSDKDLKGALGEISKRISLIRRGDFTLSRGAQLVLNEPLVDLLKSLNFDPTRKAVEDLFGYIPESLLQFSETERIEKSSSIVFIEQLISFLCLNILPLPWFDITTKAVLWNNGIEHVIELVSVDVNSIIGIPREVLKEIRLFQKSFNISRNMSETFSNYVDHSLAFPNNAERQFMKFGLSSAILLIDFIPHPLFEFEDIERSIIRIATSNMFKPLTWLTSDLQINVNQLLPLIQNGGSNIVSSLLMLSQDDELHDIHAKLTEVLNKEIIQLNPPEWSISLTDINIIPNPEILERLKAKKITYLDEFLSLDSKLAKDKDLIPVVYPIILSLKSLPLSSVDNLSPKNIERLKKSGIKNLYEFLALPTTLISEIIGVSEESVNNSKTTIDIKSLEDNVKLTGLDITLVPGLSKEAKETLSQYGCVSLVQASNLNLELLPLSVADRTHLKKSTSILLTPITLIGKSLKLKNPEIKKFLDRNIITYSDLLELPQKNWTPSVKTLLTQQKEDSNYLIRNLSNIQKHGIKIEDLGLSNNITTQLQQIGATTIEHLYYLPIDYITGNSKIKEEDILEIRSKLSLNISYLQNLAKETIDFCYEKGFISIIDHLTYIKQFPKTIREEILQSLNLVKSIKELGFTEPVSDLEMFLRNKGFYSYKSLLTSPSLKEQKEVFDAIAPYLFANIRFLDLDPKVMEKMKKAGMNIIADLYFISSQK